MAQPNNNQIHVDAPLTNISIAYMQNVQDLISMRAFASVPVLKESNIYFTYDKDAWFRSDVRKRALSTESVGSGYNLNQDSYLCEEYAIHKDLDDRLLANQDAPINLLSEASEFVTRQLMLDREINWFNKYFTTGIWTGSSTGTDITVSPLWDAANSTPIADIRAEMNAMHAQTGMLPNKLILGRDVWAILLDHPTLIARISNDATRIVTKQLIANLLELDEILVADAVVNSANEGATASLDHLFTKDCMLVYANPRPSLMQPSAGYTFNWSGYLGSNGTGMRIRRFRMEEIHSDRIEGQMAYDQKIVAPDLGVFFNNVIA